MATLQMKAIFDCEADRKGELSFKEGDILVDIVKSAEDGWFEGRLKNSSERGLFPFNYVEKVQSTSDSKPHYFAIENQDTENPKNFNYISNQLKVNSQRRNVTFSRLPSSSEESMAIKEPNDSAPAINSPRTSLRRVEKKLKPGIKLDVGSKSQSSYTPPLLNTKHAKIEREIITTPIRQRREQEVISFDSSHQLVGIHHIKLVPSNDNQLLKASQLKNNINQRNTPVRTLTLSPKIPPPLSPRITGTVSNRSPVLSDTNEIPSRINTTEKGFNSKLMIPSSKNPVPSLPSRPRSIASRKSQTNSKNKEAKEEKKGQTNSPNNKSAVPAIKPKPSSLRPTLPPRSSSSQTSSMTHVERKTPLHLTKSDDALVTRKICQSPPAIPDKPFIFIASLTKPSPPPKSAKLSRTKINCQFPANEKNEQTNPAPVGNKLSTNKEITIEVPEKFSSSLMNRLDNKKVPPPPPPSRSPRIQKHESAVTMVAARARYAILFETLQDEGYVDEDVAQTIWRKYKLSKIEMDLVWKDCGLENARLLDKDAFINSMLMFDTMVSKQEHPV